MPSHTSRARTLFCMNKNIIFLLLQVLTQLFNFSSRQLLTNVYHWHEDVFHGMGKALMYSIPAWPMITSEV